MEDTEIELIGAVAADVAAQSEAFAAARTEEQRAEALLLARVIAAIGPVALRACSTRPVLVESCTGLARDDQRETYERADWAGILVRGSIEPVEDCPRANSGSYDPDWRLYLLPDGSWREVYRTGTWSRWQGAGYAWTSEVEKLSVGDTCAEIVHEYDATEEIITALATALSRQLRGNLGKRAEQARERAAKLAAVAALLNL